MFNKNNFYRQATLHIFSSLNFETALRQCKGYLGQHLPVSGIFFAKYDPNLNTFKIATGIWPSSFDMPQHTIQLPSEWWGRLKKAWEQRSTEQNKVQIINSFREMHDITGTQESFLYSIYPVEVSQIHLDLYMEENRIGLLSIFTEGAGRYQQHHADLISTLQKPFAISMSNILQHQEITRLKDILSDDNTYLQQQIVKMSGNTVIGADTGLRDVMEMVRQVAQLNSPVLLLGETGVGKEVIANALHYSSKRKNGPFIKVNCGAIPENLIDSELFGHEKGSFTGAVTQKRGRFERANGGTIFLDEIGELPPAAQVRMLRVLQHHEIERVGGSEVLPVDVRVISATHQHLEQMVLAGRFREDLWYRLNVFPIIIPPLRHRRQDIPSLAEYFFEKKSKELRIHERPIISMDVINQFQTYHWPGNVRELENLVERSLIRGRVESTDSLFRFEGRLNATTAQVDSETEIVGSLNNIIVSYIKKALSLTGGRIDGPSGAAKLLDLKPSTLRSKMNKLGIKNCYRIKSKKVNQTQLLNH